MLTKEGIFLNSLHFLLMQAHTCVNRRILAGAAQLGLTSGQPKVLEFLLEYGEAEQKTIAKNCLIEPATAGSILLRMETAGLIARTQRENNRRSLYVSLTPAGRLAAQNMQKVFSAVDTAAVSALSAQEQQTLLELLQKVCSSAAQKEGVENG